MMRQLFFTALFCFLSIVLIGQNKKTDVIYTKNGSIYRGTIISEAETQILIDTYGGNTIAINQEEIKQITQQKYSPFSALKKQGYYNFTSMGALIGSESDPKTTNFSFIMEHNYKFHPDFAAGVTTGIDWFNVSVMPLGANLKLMIDASKYTGFYLGVTGGYAVPLEELYLEEFEVLKTNGGWLAGTDMGIVFPSIGNVHLFLAVGYRYQELSFVRSDWWYDKVERKTTFNRFNLKLGVCLN